MSFSFPFNRKHKNKRPDAARSPFRIRLALERLEDRQLLAQGVVSGTVFADLNADGFNPSFSNEPTLSGRTVFADANGNGQLDAGEVAAITNATGDYVLVLAPGKYSIRLLPGLNEINTKATAPDYTETVAEGAEQAGRHFGVLSISPAAPVLVPKTPLSEVANTDQDFIRDIYRSILGRNPDAAGLAYWSGQLALASGASVAESQAVRDSVVQQIWDSPEHLGLVVEGYYQTFLDRASDAAGKQAWINALRVGTSEDTVVRGFLTSAEYQGQHSSNTDFPTALYTDLLARAPDSTGLNTWRQALQNGAPRSAVVDGFLYSTEHLTRQVDSWYAAFLNRPADAGGRAYWLTGVQQHFLDIGQAGQGILASQESYFPGLGGGIGGSEEPETLYPMPCATELGDKGCTNFNTANAITDVVYTDAALVAAQRTVTIRNTTPDTTYYPFIRGGNDGFTEVDGQKVPWDGKDQVCDVTAPNGKQQCQEFRAYIGYQDTSTGQNYFGVKPNTEVTFHVPIALWDSSRIFMATDATYFTNSLDTSAANINNPFSYFRFEDDKTTQTRRFVDDDKSRVSGMTKEGTKPVVMYYNSRSVLPLGNPNFFTGQVAPVDDAPTQLMEFSLRDPIQHVFDSRLPSQLITDYDISYVDSMLLPVALEAPDVPAGSNRPYGYVGTAESPEAIQAAIQVFTTDRTVFAGGGTRAGNTITLDQSSKAILSNLKAGMLVTSTDDTGIAQGTTILEVSTDSSKPTVTLTPTPTGSGGTFAYRFTGGASNGLGLLFGGRGWNQYSIPNEPVAGIKIPATKNIIQASPLNIPIGSYRPGGPGTPPEHVLVNGGIFYQVGTASPVQAQDKATTITGISAADMNILSEGMLLRPLAVCQTAGGLATKCEEDQSKIIAPGFISGTSITGIDTQNGSITLSDPVVGNFNGTLTLIGSEFEATGKRDGNTVTLDDKSRTVLQNLFKGALVSSTNDTLPVGTRIQSVSTDLAKPTLTLSGTLSGSGDFKYKFTGGIHDYAAETLLNLWYGWADYYVKLKSTSPSVPLKKGTTTLGTGSEVASHLIVFQDRTDFDKLYPGMAVSSDGGNIRPGTTILRIGDPNNPKDNPNAIYLSQTVTKSSSDEKVQYTFSPPTTIRRSSVVKPMPLEFTPAAQTDANAFAAVVYSVLDAFSKIPKMTDDVLALEILQNVIGGNVGFLVGAGAGPLNSPVYIDITNVIRDQSKSLERGVVDFIKTPEFTGKWYPDPDKTSPGSTVNQKDPGFNVYSLDPYAWFVHRHLGLSAYAFSLDDDIGNVEVHDAKSFIVQVGGIQGLPGQDEWSPGAPYGTVSGPGTGVQGPPDKITGMTDAVYNSLGDPNPAGGVFGAFVFGPGVEPLTQVKQRLGSASNGVSLTETLKAYQASTYAFYGALHMTGTINPNDTDSSFRNRIRTTESRVFDALERITGFEKDATRLPGSLVVTGTGIPTATVAKPFTRVTKFNRSEGWIELDAPLDTSVAPGLYPFKFA